jgi:hypothetical protein
MELHRIIAAAVEGHNNIKQVAYRALQKNYSSLMCSSTLKTVTHEETVSSPVFIQPTFIHDATEVPHTISLTELRTAIHKLQPEDLEHPIVENPTSTIGTSGPNKNPLENLAHISIQSCTSQIYQAILTIIHTTFTKEQYEYIIIQLQKYPFNDEQCVNFKTILNLRRMICTDDQRNHPFHILFNNRLNDEQFNIFINMLSAPKNSRNKMAHGY